MRGYLGSCRSARVVTTKKPATLVVRAEYEQPSLARFDMFVSLTVQRRDGSLFTSAR